MLTSPFKRISFFAACLTTLIMTFDLPANEFEDTIPPPPVPERPTIKEKKTSEELGFIREEMPLFPGCEEIPNYHSRKKCSDSLLMAFIYGNLRYPYSAWRDSIEGMAVVCFVVEKDGTVSDARSVRDPGQGTGDEALRIVNLMNERGHWMPGTQAGKPVRVQFNLPIKFKMTDDMYPGPPPPPVTEPSIMWSWPETMPYPAACDSLNKVDPFECRNELLKTIIYDNLRWPALHRDTCVEGTVVVSFKVRKDGTLTDFEVRRSITPLLDEEALRLVKLMAEQSSPWVPGTTGPEKKPVEVQFNMPVKFRLE
jgi:TonB family protein